MKKRFWPSTFVLLLGCCCFAVEGQLNFFERLINRVVSGAENATTGPTTTTTTTPPPTVIEEEPSRSCANVDHVNINMCKYDSHQEMVDRLKALEEEAPHLAKTGIIGSSVKGKDLIYIKVRLNNLLALSN